MEFYFVERDEVGEIVGLFARPQPNIPKERLPADDPEVLAFLAGKTPDLNKDIEDRSNATGFDKGLLGMLAERLPGNVTVADLKADIKRLK